ncbi:hypothetical protein [Microbacterium paludicola]|uniref:hypothetical protein n=1 Tax=Microbacterium paludicola TaxID=300019 RepID=UPI0011A5C2C3|nr:hypothetical protein [Microbacterium paludicola]
MRKKLIALMGAALLLTGCSASNVDVARDVCVDAAESELDTSIDAGEIKAANMGDALYEAGIRDDRDASDDDAVFSVTGEFTFQKDGTESRRSMLCMVPFEGGSPGDPDLSIVGG